MAVMRRREREREREEAICAPLSPKNMRRGESLRVSWERNGRGEEEEGRGGGGREEAPLLDS